MAVFSYPAPSPLNGDALAAQLAAAGFASAKVGLVGDRVQVGGVGDEAAVGQVVASHDGQPLPLTGERAIEVDLRSKADAALSANTTFLALASPTNAQVIAQVQRLTRENNALIRLVIGKLDSTAGT